MNFWADLKIATILYKIINNNLPRFAVIDGKYTALYLPKGFVFVVSMYRLKKILVNAVKFSHVLSFRFTPPALIFHMYVFVTQSKYIKNYITYFGY